MIKLEEKVTEYFMKRHNAFEYRRGWLKMTCPFCMSENKFGVNTGMNLCNCFKCGHKSNLPKAVMEIEKLKTYHSYVKYLNEFKGVAIFKPAVKDYVVPDKILPDGFKLLRFGDSLIAKASRNHIKNRGFNVKALSRLGVGYVDSPGKYFGYLILPIRDEGKVIFFQTRRIIGNGPKFNNPTIEELGKGKSLVLFNRGILFKYTKVYIVESIFNAMTIGNQAIALLGKSVSSHQLWDILKSPVQEFIIMLDPDAYKEAVKLGMDLGRTKKVKVVLLPEGQDVNDIGKEEATKLEKNTEYQTYNDLLKIWMNLRSEETALRSY